MEFISNEHTAKNLLITAVKREKALPEAAREELRGRLKGLMDFHGVQEQRLTRHLELE
jgi:hypothetical protein